MTRITGMTDMTSDDCDKSSLGRLRRLGNTKMTGITRDYSDKYGKLG